MGVTHDLRRHNRLFYLQLSENGAIVFFQKQPTIGKQGQSSLSLGRMIKAAGPYKNRKNISFIEKECMGNQHIYGTMRNYISFGL